MDRSWKLNLLALWLGCFLVGLGMSQILPFLPLYLQQLGVTGQADLSLWSGLVFSGSFIVSAMVSPFWGKLADQRGRKLMLLRASLGMAILMAAQGFVSAPWQLMGLRMLMGLTSGYIPNAMALAAAEMPRERTGWALGTLTTGQVSGVILGPLIGGMMADQMGFRIVFLVTGGLLFCCFLCTWYLVHEQFERPARDEKPLTRQQVFASLSSPGLVLGLFIATMMIQLANGSINPILTLFVSQLSENTHNLAFISGVIAAVPGVSALFSASWLGKLGDRIGSGRILLVALTMTAALLLMVSLVQNTFELGLIRFLMGFCDGAMMPAVQALLAQQVSGKVLGRIFGYNQSFLYLGSVVGPMLGAGVSAYMGYRWVFVISAVLVLVNLFQMHYYLNQPDMARTKSA
ncbi:multidrug efflux MFS transporter [Celerinatantimonas yamalensis]|uniref:Multidrug efflux MFS transporter n=1 Tax=Celerinatantimonas yamalensis TaxID=559956 RepID=A0ABW9G6H9_9GAMM